MSLPDIPAATLPGVPASSATDPVNPPPQLYVAIPVATAAAQISTDADNQLTTGSDQRLFVPRAQAAADPLAYYILAKA